MISFVYFDLGGVVVRDFSGTNNWEELKNELGINSINDEAFDKWFDEKEPSFCKGLEIDTVLLEMKTKFNLNLLEGYSFLNSFVKRFEVNKSIWPVVEEIKKNYRIGLLTNMYPGMLSAIQDTGIMPKIEWEIIVDSSKIGYQKPDKEIYEIAQEKSGVKSSEIMFIDNTLKNIEAAKELGWQAFLYNSSNLQESSSNLLEYFKKDFKS